ncbi:MAG: NAD(P)-binding protein [Cyanobacteriota/Melainabacteria group bacterium]
MIETEVLVLGAGPAGVSCALECLDNKLDVLVLEKERQPGGQLNQIQCYPQSCRAHFVMERPWRAL